MQAPDDEIMVAIMEAAGISLLGIQRLRQIRGLLHALPLGPEFATTEALRLSFARYLRLSHHLGSGDDTPSETGIKDIGQTLDIAG